MRDALGACLQLVGQPGIGFHRYRAGPEQQGRVVVVPHRHQIQRLAAVGLQGRIKADHLRGQHADGNGHDDGPHPDLARLGLDPHTIGQGHDVGHRSGKPDRQAFGHAGNQMAKPLAAEPVVATFPGDHVPQRRIRQIAANGQAKHHCGREGPRALLDKDICK